MCLLILDKFRRVFCNLPRLPRNHQNPRRYNETQEKWVMGNYKLSITHYQLQIDYTLSIKSTAFTLEETMQELE